MNNEQCTHPNGYYYGDTNPVTYYCPDCGIFYMPAYEVKDGLSNGMQSLWGTDSFIGEDQWY